MNLIEKLGGYERAKEIAFDSLHPQMTHVSNDGRHWVNEEFSHFPEIQEQIPQMARISDIKKALLQYRRANNIYEVNDQVVLINKPHSSSSLHRVLAVNAPTTIQLCPINQVTGNDLVILGFMASPYYLRHATDAEFDANHRIENNTDHCTDIRNHLSPMTEVIER